MTPQSFAPGALPPTSPRDSRGFCCAKCRRGTPALGEFPCGFDRLCLCHVGDG